MLGGFRWFSNEGERFHQLTHARMMLVKHRKFKSQISNGIRTPCGGKAWNNHDYFVWIITVVRPVLVIFCLALKFRPPNFPAKLTTNDNPIPHRQHTEKKHSRAHLQIHSGKIHIRLTYLQRQHSFLIANDSTPVLNPTLIQSNSCVHQLVQRRTVLHCRAPLLVLVCVIL